MIATIIGKAIQYRWWVLVLVAIAAGFGVYSFRQLPIDAYPDISAQAVFVTTTYPGRAPEEVELQVTIPVELAMRNVPRAEVVRSRTIFGLSVVEVVSRREPRTTGRGSVSKRSSWDSICPREYIPTWGHWCLRAVKFTAMNWSRTEPATLWSYERLMTRS